MSLNVTVMLVLTTMFVGISAKLPETAYIKMIDLWLILSLLKPFLDIIIQTYIERLRAEEEDSEISQKEGLGMMEIPSITQSRHGKQFKYI